MAQFAPTAGLVLEPLTVADSAAYYAVLDRNRAHLGRHGDYQAEATATPEWVTAHLAQEVPDRFGIRLGDDLIGRVDLVHAAPPRYGLGYWLTLDATGRGHATLTCAAVIDYARTERDAGHVRRGDPRQ